jgi:glucose-1-phosphate adenylyltransferase
MRDVLAIILAGGEGKRLYPLTRDRAKPAVPFGGIYRLIDFTMSNVVNSGVRKTLVLSQYKSDSLHRHIQFGWNIFNPAFDEFITALPPQKRINDDWYNGTASAVHQNLYAIRSVSPKYVLILSADHVYKMDYSKMLEYHESVGADLTLGAIEVDVKDAHRFGIIRTNGSARISGFLEKPLSLDDDFMDDGAALGSMGIYLFKTEALLDILEQRCLHGTAVDFGADILPSMLGSHRVVAYPFVDENKKEAEYWRDVGTIDAYWEANMDLVSVDPVFNLYDEDWPIRTYHRQYPPAKTVFAGGDATARVARVYDSIISNGCIVSGGTVQNSVLSPGVRINSYSEVSESILMDRVQVGRHSRIRRAIIDKGVVIPRGTVIGYDYEEDRKRFTVSDDGIVVIPKGEILPPAPLMSVSTASGVAAEN